MCLDVSGGRDADGQRVHLWNCHNGWNQKWIISYKAVPYTG